MSSSHMPGQINESPQLSDDEIDLSEVVAALLRHKLLIASISVATSVLSGIYALTLKPVWEGSFQIVVEDQNSAPGGRLAELAASNPMLANLAGLSGGASQSTFETEVQILQSPSVLMPVFNFFKSLKEAKGKDVSELIYSDWVKNNLSIELVKGTSILNLAYQDTDENLVLPVLEKITTTYQEYSKRDNANSIDNALKFANEQSVALGQMAKESNRKLDVFKFTYGIRDQLNEVNPTDLTKLSSPLPSIPKSADPLAELAVINKELTRRRQFFTEGDPSIKRLQKERHAILQYIDQTGGGSISIAGGGSKKLNREILLNYKELKRTAMRDNAALTAIESELLSLQIQKAQERQPWELISTPTLLDSPVAPHKERIVTLGFIAGLIVGSGCALIRDKRSGLVFTEKELKTLLPCPLIKHLPAMSQNTWADAAGLLAAGPLAKVPENSVIAMIPIGDVPKDQLQAFSAELSDALEGRELLVSTDLRETSYCATQLLVTSPGVATRTELSQLCQKLALQGAPLAGWVFLDPELRLK